MDANNPNLSIFALVDEDGAPVVDRLFEDPAEAIAAALEANALVVALSLPPTLLRDLLAPVVGGD